MTSVCRFCRKSVAACCSALRRRWKHEPARMVRIIRRDVRVQSQRRTPRRNQINGVEDAKGLAAGLPRGLPVAVRVGSQVRRISHGSILDSTLSHERKPVESLTERQAAESTRNESTAIHGGNRGQRMLSELAHTGAVCRVGSIALAPRHSDPATPVVGKPDIAEPVHIHPRHREARAARRSPVTAVLPVAGARNHRIGTIRADPSNPVVDGGIQVSVTVQS